MILATDLLAEFEATGRLWLRRTISPGDLETLETLSEPGRAGARLDAGRALAGVGPDSSVGRALHAFWPGMRPVCAVAFSKDAETHWGVAWHQDRVIAVRERAEVPGFSNWSSKGGRCHCEPPREVLDAMLFVRLHLDSATPANGPMEIALGSHRRGPVRSEEAQTVAEAHSLETCLAERGDILVLKMLTLHRSGPSIDVQPRRAMRVDFAAAALPHPLQWASD